MADTTLIVPAPDRSHVRRKLRYYGEKLGGSPVSLFAIILTSFFLFRIIPGDPVRTMTHGRPVSIEQQEQLRRDFGQDEPLAEQFWHT